MKHAPLARCLAAVAALACSVPAMADLTEGARAPDFTTDGALAGKAFHFHLAEALKHGPVVLYFYPKAFTSGCTLEAHAFAEAAPQFKAAGATLLGMSADDLPALEKFSVAECRNAFPVATATPATIKAYDVPLKMVGVSTGLTSRTSYLIAPDGRVALVYDNMDYKDHVAKTLAAVKALKK